MVLNTGIKDFWQNCFIVCLTKVKNLFALVIIIGLLYRHDNIQL